MSRVFLATERQLSRRVVLKALSPELACGVSSDRFEREIRTAAQLQDPRIVPLFGAGVADGVPYYTMPFVEGVSLRADRAGGRCRSTKRWRGSLPQRCAAPEIHP